MKKLLLSCFFIAACVLLGQGLALASDSYSAGSGYEQYNESGFLKVARRNRNCRRYGDCGYRGRHGRSYYGRYNDGTRYRRSYRDSRHYMHGRRYRPRVYLDF